MLMCNIVTINFLGHNSWHFSEHISSKIESVQDLSVSNWIFDYFKLGLNICKTRWKICTGIDGSVTSNDTVLWLPLGHVNTVRGVHRNQSHDIEVFVVLLAARKFRSTSEDDSSDEFIE